MIKLEDIYRLAREYKCDVVIYISHNNGLMSIRITECFTRMSVVIDVPGNWDSETIYEVVKETCMGLK